MNIYNTNALLFTVNTSTLSLKGISNQCKFICKIHVKIAEFSNDVPV